MMRFLNIALFVVYAVGLLAGGMEAGIRSEKRGVSANNLTAEQAALLEPGVSWIYNWGPDPGNLDLDGRIAFVPMVWGENNEQLVGVKAWLEAGATPEVILVLNEPNLRGQAFITPLAAAEWMDQVHETLSPYGVPLIGPQMSLGSTTEDAITAYDPIQQVEVTYTTMQSYLNAYDYYVAPGLAAGIAVHPYGNAGELRWAVDQAYERYGQPVWVTEFAFWDAPTEEDEYAYMIEALDFLERSDKVAGYAWFKADLGSRSKLSLLESTGATLTRLGELYVNFPAHDPDYHHPVPGRVEAEAYATRENVILQSALSPEGMAALYNGRGTAWVSYRIDVAETGYYNLRFRIASEGFEPVTEAVGTASEDPPESFERDLHFRTRLEAGPQVMRILLNGLNAQLDWLEFSLEQTESQN